MSEGQEAPAGRATPGLASQLGNLSASLASPGMSTGDRATLRRMDPESPSRAMPVLVPLLLKAGVPVDVSPEQLRRWARIVHAMALLAGTSGEKPHAPSFGEGGAASRDAGRALAQALGYSPQSPRGQNRMFRLTTSRGPALHAQAPRLMRMLAAAGSRPIDFHPIASLLLNEGRNEEKADAARLRLARGFFTAGGELSAPASGKD